MKKRLQRMALALAIGLGVLVGGFWLLSLTLGNNQVTLYQGKLPFYWREELNSQNRAVSNQANAVLNTQFIPKLVDKMFHDTNDSSFRLALVAELNSLPCIQINFTPAAGRRSSAVNDLGGFGPAAKAAIPALIQAVKGNDEGTRSSAITALGEIHGEPEVVIPLLITYLDDKDLNDEAADALGKYGTLAKAAVPRLIPLLRIPDKDLQQAVREALKQIEPDLYQKMQEKTRQEIRERVEKAGSK